MVKAHGNVTKNLNSHIFYKVYRINQSTTDSDLMLNFCISKPTLVIFPYFSFQNFPTPQLKSCLDLKTLCLWHFLHPHKIKVWFKHFQFQRGQDLDSFHACTPFCLPQLLPDFVPILLYLPRIDSSLTDSSQGSGGPFELHTDFSLF